MDASMSNKYDPDQAMVENIVAQLKSRGSFDQFRKECMSDVDTKPAYQNLCQQTNKSVSSYLSQVEWSPNLNKNQLRENIRKYMSSECNFIDPGVERVVDQVVNPKINSALAPSVEDMVYQFVDVKLNKDGYNSCYNTKQNNYSRGGISAGYKSRPYHNLPSKAPYRQPYRKQSFDNTNEEDIISPAYEPLVTVDHNDSYYEANNNDITENDSSEVFKSPKNHSNNKANCKEHKNNNVRNPINDENGEDDTSKPETGNSINNIEEKVLCKVSPNQSSDGESKIKSEEYIVRRNSEDSHQSKNKDCDEMVELLENKTNKESFENKINKELSENKTCNDQNNKDSEESFENKTVKDRKNVESAEKMESLKNKTSKDLKSKDDSHQNEDSKRYSKAKDEIGSRSRKHRDDNKKKNKDREHSSEYSTDKDSGDGKSRHKSKNRIEDSKVKKRNSDIDKIKSLDDSTSRLDKKHRSKKKLDKCDLNRRKEHRLEETKQKNSSDETKSKLDGHLEANQERDNKQKTKHNSRNNAGERTSKSENAKYKSDRSKHKSKGTIDSSNNVSEPDESENIIQRASRHKSSEMKHKTNTISINETLNHNTKRKIKNKLTE